MGERRGARTSAITSVQGRVQECEENGYGGDCESEVWGVGLSARVSMTVFVHVEADTSVWK